MEEGNNFAAQQYSLHTVGSENYKRAPGMSNAQRQVCRTDFKQRRALNTATEQWAVIVA